MSSNKVSQWSIGIYEGPSILRLKPAGGSANPVLTASDVDDCDALFVADPFMMREKGAWHLFFEVMDKFSGLGRIGCASSEDGRIWRYGQLVLKEPFHLSYPFVFRSESQIWMIPETLQDRSVRLYRAVEFPFEWTFETKLLEGDFADATLTQNDDTWFMFSTQGHFREATLKLHVSESPFGPWREHPRSPVRTRPQKAVRPAGRIVFSEGRRFLFTQDSRRRYGHRVWAYEILELNSGSYKERRISRLPFIGATHFGWSAHGMHHVDAHLLEDGGWFACVDGFRRFRPRPERPIAPFR